MTSSQQRRYDLDWLRIIAFGLLIFYHIGMFYVSWGFHVKSVHAGPDVEPLMKLVNPWRMTVLFLISGVALRFAMDKTSLGRFAWARFWRLFLPLVFGMLVIVAPQSWLELLEKGETTASFGSFYGQYLSASPDYSIILPTWNHLWYVAYLIVYTFILVALYPLVARISRRIPQISGKTPLLFAAVLLVPVSLFALNELWLEDLYPSTHALVDDWGNHALYFPFLLIAFLAAKSVRVWQILDRLFTPALIIAPLLAMWQLFVWSLSDADIQDVPFIEVIAVAHMMVEPMTEVRRIAESKAASIVDRDQDDGSPPSAQAAIEAARTNATSEDGDTPGELSDAEQAQVEKLKARDREVRAHEQAHATVGGQYAGAPSYTYQTGPDNQRYAVGGEVSIDTAPVDGDAEATVEKMDVVIAAALAPAEPSPQDRKVAALAQSQRAQAMAELLSERAEARRLDFRNGLNRIAERIEMAAGGGDQFDLHKGDIVLAHLTRIQHAFITTDISLFFEAAQTREAWGLAETHLIRKLADRKTPIGLHCAQDSPVKQDEAPLARQLADQAQLDQDARKQIQATAKTLTQGLLLDAQRPSVVDAFLSEFTLGSEEGILLMRLAESLIRTPDAATARRLLRDKLLAGNWSPHFGAKSILVKLGTLGLLTAKLWARLSGGADAQNVFAQIGDRVMLPLVRRAISILGRHYVLGTSIARATQRARTSVDFGTTFSYDMLGEAAHTEADSERYFAAYQRALTHLAKDKDPSTGLHEAPALSVKLSALHPRYEYAQRDRCVPVLAERVLTLCRLAKSANIGLTIDAEEAERLEVSLLVIDAVLASGELSGWEGFGLAIQAYQRRASHVIDWVIAAAQRYQQRFTIRLVKGAYWDSEIKRAQALGLSDYPVFTRKEHTDISYLACARKLLEAQAWIYPQFATHNAHTAAAILHMAGDRRDLEFQRLHGMSDGLHRRLAEAYGFATRTYAPVGQHHELLPYLVRRLLENGANASFVNQLQSDAASVEQLIRDPIEIATAQRFAPHPKLGAPYQRPGSRRTVATGQDLTQSNIARAIEQLPAPALPQPRDTATSVDDAAAETGASDWPNLPPETRSRILRRAADALNRDRHTLMALCVHEAHKTWPDAEAELREAIDFLRYYADHAMRPSMANRQPLGTVACISPWNFPLAIFLGQVSAALSVGNTVIAKPAEQTPRIAIAAVARLYEAGVPEDALQLVIGDGRVGAQLVSHPVTQAVCFTGSTATAKRIARALAGSGRGTLPLIAETGGINAMIVDSTALLEQAVQDVIDSAFQSAGQRCSACRLVCVQEDIADAFITMLSGAMSTLRVAAPADLTTDLGPLIDTDAFERVAAHIDDVSQRFQTIGEAPAPADPNGNSIAPIAFELNSVSDLEEEVFGPVLHLVRFKAGGLDKLIGEINALGFGLTMGLHSRIDARIDRVRQLAKVGNLYINRNQIGAMVERYV
eukprot:g2608.t1